MGGVSSIVDGARSAAETGVDAAKNAAEQAAEASKEAAQKAADAAKAAADKAAQLANSINLHDNVPDVESEVAGMPGASVPAGDNSSLNGYDMIYCVTEAAVNKSFKSLFDLKDVLPTTWQSADDSQDSLYTIHATLGCPRVSFQLPAGTTPGSGASAASSDFSTLIFFTLPITEGALTFPDFSKRAAKSGGGDGGSLPMTSLPAAGWELELQVNVDLKQETGAGAGALSDRLKPLPPGSFSVQQMVLDFENPALIAEGHVLKSAPNLTAETKENATFKTKLLSLVVSLLKTFRDSGNPVLIGSVRLPTGDNSSAPTFTPTGVRASVKRNAEHPELSTLNYLFMTAGKDFPAGAAAGAFQTPFDVRADQDGQLLVSRDLLLKNLLDSLATVFAQPAAGFREASVTKTYEKGSFGWNDGDMTVWVIPVVGTSRVVIKCFYVIKRDVTLVASVGTFHTWNIWENHVDFALAAADGRITSAAAFNLAATTGSSASNVDEIGSAVGDALAKASDAMTKAGQGLADAFSSSGGAAAGAAQSAAAGAPQLSDLFANFGQQTMVMPGQGTLAFSNLRFGGNGYFKLDTAWAPETS